MVKTVRLYPLIAAVILLLCMPVTVQGESRTGSIAGTVTDPTGAVLQGVQVAIGHKGISETTGQQGSFLRSDLKPGSYQVTFSYVGFKTLRETVQVVAGETTKVNAQLKLSSKVQSVIVTAARAGGEAEAINTERSAATIEEVMPRQVIRSLPNANIADSVGRLPNVSLDRDEGEGKYIEVRGTEPRLTNAMIDGINIPSAESGVRQFKFDILPADSVESVQLHKTLQADMPGDGIGGSVNLVTMVPTDRPDYSIGAMGGFTPIINGRGVTEEDAAVGKRFGASRKFGVLISGSYDYNGRGIDDIEPVPDIATLANGKTETWFDAMDIRQYEYMRKRYGLTGDVDYRIHQGDVYLKGIYADFMDDENKWVYSLTDNTPPSQVTLLNGNGYNTSDGVGEGTPALENPLATTDSESTGALILGGNQVLNTTWYSWNLSAARSYQSGGNLADTTFSYIGGGTSNCKFDPVTTTNVHLPRWTSDCYNEAYNPANWELDNNSSIERDKGLTAQLNLEGSGSFGKRYNIGQHSSKFQFGGRFTNAHKYADTYSLDWTPDSGVAIPMTKFGNYLTDNHYYLGGQYPFGYHPNGYAVNQYLNAHMDQFQLTSTKGIDPSFFDLVEQVGAGYLMNTIDISNRLRFYAGFRVEHTSDSIKNFSVGDSNCTNATCVTPNAFSGSYTTLLPSASLNYGFDSNNELRLIYARGLSRPDYSDLAQALSWSTNANGSHKGTVSFGNANLKAETGDDIDFLYDHYFNAFGMFSAGVFYKYLANPIILQSGTLQNYLPPGAPQSDKGSWFYQQPVNAGHAWVTGLEASYIQHFTFLPGVWKGLGINANWGHNWSGTSEIPGRSDHPSLQRTDPNAFNITPTFDSGRLSTALGLTYNQANIQYYQYADGMAGGVNGPLSDIYFYTHFQVDAQGSVYLGRGMKLIVSGMNLNNEVFGFYQGSPQYMIQREYYEPTYSFGVRWNPAWERHRMR